MKVILKLFLYLPSLGLAVLVEHAMWHGSAYWALLGIPGLLVSYLLGGPHGGDHLATMIASILSVVADSTFYFFLCWWLIRLWNRRFSSRQILG